MSFAFGLLMILTGLTMLGFGLFLFYAWLPVLYAIVGFDVGLLLGRILSGDVGWLAFAAAIGGALVLGVASYLLEPYRRILIGASVGVLLGAAVPGAFGLDGTLGLVLGPVLALICGVVGGVVVPLFFDALVIASTAVSGTAMIVIGLHRLFPGVSLFDYTSGGSLLPLLALALSLVGGIWQYRNIGNRVHMLPAGRTAEDRRGK